MIKILKKARKFLDHKFPDHRNSKDIQNNMSKSYNNCFPTALFLENILKKSFPDQDWKAVHGYYFVDSHAFLYSEKQQRIIDITGDQFHNHKILITSLQHSDYEIKEAIDLNHHTVSKNEKELVLSWIQEWNLLI